MSTIASSSLVTPEELERMPDSVAYELVDGQLGERNLGAGARLVWIVTPTTQTVRIHRPRGAANAQISFLSAKDRITGEDVLPGFAATVQDFFEV